MCTDQPGSPVMVEFKFSSNPFSEDSRITFPPLFFEELGEDIKRRAALIRSAKSLIWACGSEQVVEHPDAGADAMCAVDVDAGVPSEIKDRPLNVCPVTGRLCREIENVIHGDSFPVGLMT